MEAETKVCTRCNAEKPLDLFYRKKDGRLGRMAHCKACDDEKCRLRRQENPEKVREERKAWAKANPEKVAASKANWKRENRDHVREVDAIWRANNPELVKEKGRRSSANWRKSTKNRIHASVSAGIRKALKSGKGGAGTFSLLPYSVEELMRHLERRFQPGMSWDNYGAGSGRWHIDHKIPQSVFNFDATGQIDFQKCWALSNLQPMWSEENMAKGDRGYGAFQPSLALGIPANDNNPKKKAA